SDRTGFKPDVTLCHVEASRRGLEMADASPDPRYVRWFDALRNTDVALVGGKNASLGELIRHLGGAGVRVPGGFATTAGAYRAFLRHNQLDEVLRDLTQALSRGERSLQDVGSELRRAIRRGTFPDDIAEAIRDGYRE